MASQLRLEIVTPEGKAYSEDVSMVVLPGTDGELGILPDHVPLITQCQPGELTITRDGQQTSLAIGSGVVEIAANHVWVLTDMAIEAEKIDEDAVRKAIERAEAERKQTEAGSEEYAAIEASLMKSFAQLKVKRRRSL